MKRQLTVALGLVVIATPAFATKARMEALGEDNFGSYYINDNRNIFLNPARINENKDFVTYEFGQNGNALTAQDSAATPRAGGGFARSHGNMVYGLHFGDSSPTTALLRGLTAATNELQERQPWDLFVGGDAGVKWGASFTYENFDGGSATAGTRYLSQAMKVRGGVIMGDLEGFAHVSLNNKAQDYNGNKVEGDLGLLLGAGYMLNNYKLFADYTQADAEYNTGAAADEDFSFKRIRVGAGRQERLNDRATIFAKAMLTQTTTDDDGAGYTSAPSSKVQTRALPLSVGLEYAATSWLDLRASVLQNLWSQQEVNPNAAGKTTSGNVANTSVRAGASLKFGEFSIDGLIATNNAGNGAGATADGSNDSAGNLRADNLMTRVSMIYRF